MKVGEHEVKDGYHYTKKHEWVQVVGDKVRVGITDYAQSMMGEITFIDLVLESGPLNEGASLKAGDKIAEIESHKAVEDVFSGVSGTVAKTNTQLTDLPGTVNEDPYGKGWFIEVTPSNLDKDKQALLTPKQYADFLKEELEKS